MSGTPERIVVRGYAPRAWFAADAELIDLTEDRAQAHRFPTVQTARAAIVAACDDIPALCAHWHTERPSIADEAAAFIDPAAR